jgi:hypothetical protein
MRLRSAATLAVMALLVGVLCTPARGRVPPQGRPRQPSQVVRVVKDRGFSWRDAGIGAAAAGIAVAVIAGGSLALLKAQRTASTRN